MFFNEDDVTTDGSDATTEVAADETPATEAPSHEEEAPATETSGM